MSQTAINYTNITFGNGENKFIFFFKGKNSKIREGKKQKEKKMNFVLFDFWDILIS